MFSRRSPDHRLKSPPRKLLLTPSAQHRVRVPTLDSPNMRRSGVAMPTVSVKAQHLKPALRLLRDHFASAALAECKWTFDLSFGRNLVRYNLEVLVRLSDGIRMGTERPISGFEEEHWFMRLLGQRH